MWKNIDGISDDVIFYRKPKKKHFKTHCQGKMKETWNFPNILPLQIEFKALTFFGEIKI